MSRLEPVLINGPVVGFAGKIDDGTIDIEVHQGYPFSICRRQFDPFVLAHRVGFAFEVGADKTGGTGGAGGEMEVSGEEGFLLGRQIRNLRIASPQDHPTGENQVVGKVIDAGGEIKYAPTLGHLLDLLVKKGGVHRVVGLYQVGDGTDVDGSFPIEVLGPMFRVTALGGEIGVVGRRLS